jgi:NAD(P)-dependent dehydrogenase (short-subunit alcohol dehydrogenase family)
MTGLRHVLYGEVASMGFFSGKTAIVTGAGSGIGCAIALALADAGCKVMVTDIVEERVNEVVDELKSKGAETGGYVVDHSKREEVEKLAEDFFAEWGHVDILCSNAGVGHGGRMEEIPLEDWEWLLGINLWGAIYMLYYFVPKMIEREQGSILLTSSGAGIVPMPCMAPYNTSKYAVMGLGETLRQELYIYNIKVSVLCPGVINTNIIRDGKVHLYNEDGGSAQAELEEFYATKGIDPSIVAKHALRGLEKDTGIILAPPSHALPQYIVHRISPSLYHGIARYIWKKGSWRKVLGIEP